jgi:hypothetical protein
MVHDLDEVAAAGRLAAREMDVEDPERGRLRQNPFPGLRVEFAIASLKLERVRAIRTAERAAMRQFRQDSKRRRDGAHRSSIRLAASSASSARTSAAIRARSAA